MRECPFGEMMDKSQLVDVIKHIMNNKNVIAMYAPAAAAQFRVEPGQLEGALLAAGFSNVIEVAIGADITADREAEEFTERMEKGEKIMTTSCCPAFVGAVRSHVPELENCVSDTHTPMHYTAEIAKKEYPDCVTVFVGPCLAKRREGMDDDLVDYVISIEEVGALFIAKEIDVAKAAPTSGNELPTRSGRNFAKSGGVAQAVKVRLKDASILKAEVIDGLDKTGMKRLTEFGKINTGKLPYKDDTPNLVEVMSCQGGCIAGPSVVTNPKVALMLLTKYVESGVQDDK
jgi:iron only hydrogenase large subunit-like protein